MQFTRHLGLMVECWDRFRYNIRDTFRTRELRKPKHNQSGTGLGASLKCLLNVLQNTPLFIQYILSGYLKAKTGLAQIRWLLVGKVPSNSGAPKRISGEVISQLIGSATDCDFDKYEEAIQRIIQLPIDLTPMMALAYLYHGSSEFYVEDVFALSESREGPYINYVRA